MAPNTTNSIYEPLHSNPLIGDVGSCFREVHSLDHFEVDSLLQKQSGLRIWPHFFEARNARNRLLFSESRSQVEISSVLSPWFRASLVTGQNKYYYHAMRLLALADFWMPNYLQISQILRFTFIADFCICSIAFALCISNENIFRCRGNKASYLPFILNNYLFAHSSHKYIARPWFLFSRLST